MIPTKIPLSVKEEEAPIMKSVNNNRLSGPTPTTYNGAYIGVSQGSFAKAESGGLNESSRSRTPTQRRSTKKLITNSTSQGQETGLKEVQEKVLNLGTSGKN